MVLLWCTVQVVNEVLQGMRVVKAYAWEKSFQESVTGIRAVELEAMKSRVWLRAVQSCLMLATPTLIMVVSAGPAFGRKQLQASQDKSLYDAVGKGPLQL